MGILPCSVLLPSSPSNSSILFRSQKLSSTTFALFYFLSLYPPRQRHAAVLTIPRSRRAPPRIVPIDPTTRSIVADLRFFNPIFLGVSRCFVSDAPLFHLRLGIFIKRHGTTYLHTLLSLPVNRKRRTIQSHGRRPVDGLQRFLISHSA